MPCNPSEIQVLSIFCLCPLVGLPVLFIQLAMGKVSAKRYIDFFALPACECPVSPTQVPLCQMAHLITRDSWKCTIVICPGRRGNWFGKWLSSLCCGFPTLHRVLCILSPFSFLLNLFVLVSTCLPLFTHHLI